MYNFECFRRVYLVTNNPLHVGHIQGTYRSAINCNATVTATTTNAFNCHGYYLEGKHYSCAYSGSKQKKLVTLTKEQAAILLPLLPNLAGIIFAQSKLEQL